MRVMRVCGAFYFTGGFMAQYDGSIIIKALINTLGLKRGENEIQGSINRISNSARKLSSFIAGIFVTGKLAQFGKEAINIASDFEAMESQFSQVFGELEEAASASLSNVANQAGILEDRMKSSFTKIAAFAKTTGMDTASSLKLSERAMIAVADSAAFYDRSLEETTEYLQSFLKGNYENDSALGLSATEFTRNAAANKLYGKSFIELSEAQKQLTLLQMVEDANRLSGALGQAAREADTWTNQIGNLGRAWSSLKANIGKIFLPAAIQAVKSITNIINAINRMISKLHEATKAFRSFGELLTGKTGTSTISKEETPNIKEEYSGASDAADKLANSTDKVAEATKKAKKEAEGYLSPLDEINKFSKKDTKEDEGIGEALENIDYKKIEETETVFDNLNDSIDKVVKKLKELAGVFKQGFWDGLGDWQYRWKSIQDSIASIKNILKNIFTDPEVLSSFDKWIKSIVYMLGSIVGAIASIGLTIATNLLGGIALYLEQNQGRIKDYLVSMFNIRSEVNYMFADLFRSIAYVFEAFASENGQRLTANVVGIFADAFMGVAEISSKFGRDILGILIQPFVDNRESFRTALEGFLGVLADVAGTIKEGVDTTFSKLNEVYDAHFKPFFDSVAQGLSNLVGEFMGFWNEHVQPLLEQMAEGFDELWKSHLQPLIDDTIELLGKLADLLKMIWEEIVSPFISWIIQNVLPKILPVIQGIWDALKEACAWALDIFDSIINKLGEFIDWLTEHKGIVEDFIIVIGSFIAAFAIAKLVTSIAGIVSALTAFVTGAGLATVASTVLSGALGILGGVLVFLASPIGLITVAIGAIIAAFVLLYKHSEKFRNFVNGIADAAKEIVPGIIKGIGDGLSELGKCIKNLGEKILNGFKDFFGIHSPSTVMYEQASMLMQGVMNGINAHKDSVNRIWESMKNAITGTWSSVKESTSSAWDSIKQNSSQKWNNISQDIGGKLNEIKNKFSNFNINSSATWKNLWNGMVSAINGPINTIKNTVNTAFNWISDKVKTLTKKLNDLSKKSSGLSKGSSSSTKNISLKSKGFSLDYGPALSAPVSQAFASLSNKDFPGYATGQVIPRTMKQHLAWLGDNNKETEVVSPLSTIEQAVVNAMNRSGSGEITIKIPIYLDGKKITEAVVNYGKIQQMSTGNNIFNLE